MNILVFNCGSSSLKYRLLEMPGERELADVLPGLVNEGASILLKSPAN